MRNLLRSLSIGLAATLGLASQAQQTLVVYGQVSPCAAMVNTLVTIQVSSPQGPDVYATTLVGEDCYYNTAVTVDYTEGTVRVSGDCPNGYSDLFPFNLAPGATLDLPINVECDTTPSTYQVHVSGHVSPCTLLDNTVTVRCTSCTPWIEVVANVDSNCDYGVTFGTDAPEGIVVVATGCSNGLVPNNTMHYIVNPSVGETSLTLNLSCDAGPSEACFGIEQVAPFTAAFGNCSTGCLPPFEYLWDFSDAGTYEGDSVTHTFPGPGLYAVCLNVTGADGCTAQTCQQVVVDEDGTVNPDPTPCEAGFWLIQAYQNNPVSGDPEPIAGEVWVWNLTSPDGTYEFLWDFGDGSTSTQAYPTHQYTGNGPFTLCLTITGNGCTDTYCEDVEIDDDGLLRDGGFLLTVLHELPMSIADAPAISEMRTWPNPATDELNVGLSSVMKGLVELRVMDLSGRMVLNEPRALSTGSNTLRVAIGQLEPGVYLLHVGDRRNGVTQRFVKTR